ncbi:hypothetical protein J1N35_038316 [Gossypium stocksii]|uniref:Uncharacterized protein n=1 Tax=Gossypium stocksii TaxID=47602 RepID=A0A9D3ULM0_9ROSI|nr:hypothetical protein J1N35_038316 [Gossypium stocksii]
MLMLMYGPTPMSLSMPISILTSILTYSSFATSYCYSPIVSQTPTASLFYRGGSSIQPHFRVVEDRRWEARMALHSSMKKGDGDKDESDGGYEDEDESGDKDEYDSRGEDEEYENDHNQVEEPTPLVVYRNSMRTC